MNPADGTMHTFYIFLGQLVEFYLCFWFPLCFKWSYVAQYTNYTNMYFIYSM